MGRVLAERLRTVDSGEPPETIDGTPLLDHRRSWLLGGDARELDAVQESLPSSVTSRPDSGLLVLDFGNAVGRVSLGDLGDVELRSGKFSETEFDEMLTDLARISGNLPYSAATEVRLPYARELTGEPDTLYHAYCYLKYALSARPPPGERLLPALRSIVSRPHRRFDRESRLVPVEEARSLAPGSETELLSRLTASEDDASLETLPGPIRRRFGGAYPDRVRERVVRQTVDTQENRFVKTFLAQVALTLRRVQEEFGEEGRSSAFAERVIRKCGDLLEELAPVSRRRLWREIGESRHLPIGSTVLQRRRGYRTVLKHFSGLHGASTVPLDASNMRRMLETKDIALLYELWAFFDVVRAVISVLGEPSEAARLRVTPTEVKAQRGLAVRWPGEPGVIVTYNRWFGAGMRPGSYSTGLRPDVTVEIGSEEDRVVHLMDAKFRIRNGDDSLVEIWSADSETQELERGGTYRSADLYKMHTYRDAIRGVRTAWTLYPGSDFIFYPEDGSGPIRDADVVVPGASGVGAMPLVPGGPTEHMEQVVAGLIRSG